MDQDFTTGVIVFLTLLSGNSEILDGDGSCSEKSINIVIIIKQFLSYTKKTVRVNIIVYDTFSSHRLASFK